MFWEEAEVFGSCEKKVEVEVLEGLDVRLGKHASSGIESTLTFEIGSTRATFLMAASILVFFLPQFTRGQWQKMG